MGIFSGASAQDVLQAVPNDKDGAGQSYGDTSANPNTSGGTYDTTLYGGIGRQVNVDGQGRFSWGQDGADIARQRYQQMGADGNNRAAPQASYDLANQYAQYGRQARGTQDEAIDMMRGAANGSAPSRAEILGGQMAQQGIDSQMAMAGSARGGPLQQATAMRGAQMGQAAYQQNATNQMQGLRADEIAHARDAFMGAASTQRAQDYGAMDSTAKMDQFNTQMQGQQNALNQQNQQYFEGMGNDVAMAQQRAGLANAGLTEGARQFDEGASERAGARQDAFVGSIIGGVAGAAGGGISGSDIRMKENVQPMAQRPMGSVGAWMPPYAMPSSLLTSDAHSKREQRLMGQAEGIQQGMDLAMTQPSATQASLDAPQYRDPNASDGPDLATMGQGMQSQMDASRSLPPATQAALDQPQYRDPNASAVPGVGDKPGGIVRQNPYGGDDIIRDNPYLAANAPASSPTNGQQRQAMMGGMSKLAGAFAGGASAGGSYGGTPLTPGMGPTVNYNDYLATSDPAAKRGVYLLGRAHEHEALKTGKSVPFAFGGPPRADEDIIDQDPDHAIAGVRGVANASNTGGAGVVPDARSSPPAQMMDGIGSGVAFKYKNGVGEDPNVQRYGTTTQDLKSTPMGSSMVTRAPSGYEAIDTRQAVGPLLASVGNLNQRLREVEAVKKPVTGQKREQ